MDIKQILIEFVDHLAPKLDTYEQVIYLYILRHSHLIGSQEVIIGFKSARRKMAFGIGEKGKPMSENSIYERLRSLESKGCIKVIDTVREGSKIRLYLPHEIAGLIPPQSTSSESMSIEEADFFNVPDNRLTILRREDSKCFYCRRDLDSNNYVIEHVVSRPEGDNSYRNIVAACRNCNNRKNDISAEDYLRTLYHESFLSSEELEDRIKALSLLKNGELKPTFTK